MTGICAEGAGGKSILSDRGNSSLPHRVCEDRVLAADTLIVVRKSEMKLPAPTQRCTYLLGGELLLAAIRPRSKKSVIYLQRYLQGIVVVVRGVMLKRVIYSGSDTEAQRSR